MMEGIKIEKCPICEGCKLEVFFEYSGFRLIHCLKCDLIMNEHVALIMQGSSPDGLIDETYDDSWIMMRQQYIQDTFLQHASFNILLLEVFCPHKGDLLEIGSGTGEFIFMAKNAGWNATGVEPSEKACIFADERFGIQMINHVWQTGVLEQNKKFEAIVFWHVLEHMADPVGFLKGISGLLKPDGKIFLSIPNRDSFTNAAYGPYSPLFMERDHLFHYNAANLTLLLEKAGLKPVSLFSRETYQKMESDLNALSKISNRPDSGSLDQMMGMIARLQSQHQGHELFCIAVSLFL